jgi:F0F1-type ATP synthase assembly protein I
VSETDDQPERQMAKRALLPGAVLAVAAFGIGYAVNGPNAAVSALAGVVVVSLSFAGYVVILGRARRVSAGAMQAATLGGWLIRLAIIVGCLFAVRALRGDVAAFGFAAIATAIAVAMYEAYVVLTGKLQPGGEPSGVPPVGSGA